MTANNICACPDPPGGSIRCEPHQAAYCRIINGTTESGCVDPPATTGMTTEDAKRQLNNWALELVTKIPRQPGDLVNSIDEGMLASGVYNDGVGMEVRFNLPWDVYTGELKVASDLKQISVDFA